MLSLKKPLALVTLTDLQDYADFLLGEHPEASTRARMLATLNEGWRAMSPHSVRPY